MQFRHNYILAFNILAPDNEQSLMDILEKRAKERRLKKSIRKKTIH